MSAEEKFIEFHTDNPEIYNLLVRFARKVKEAGLRTYSINALFERVRWHVEIETKDKASGFKLNNNYRSRYARLISQMEPDLAGFFRTRVITRA